MAIPSTGKIDVLKISKEHLYQGKTAKYLDFAIWPNRNGPDDHGNTHFITQSVSKEARAAGIKGAIIGNLKLISEEPARQQPTRPSAPPKPPRNPDLDSDDDCPF